MSIANARCWRSPAAHLSWVWHRKAMGLCLRKVGELRGFWEAMDLFLGAFGWISETWEPGFGWKLTVVAYSTSTAVLVTICRVFPVDLKLSITSTMIILVLLNSVYSYYACRLCKYSYINACMLCNSGKNNPPTPPGHLLGVWKVHLLHIHGAPQPRYRGQTEETLLLALRPLAELGDWRGLERMLQRRWSHWILGSNPIVARNSQVNHGWRLWSAVRCPRVNNIIYPSPNWWHNKCCTKQENYVENLGTLAASLFLLGLLRKTEEQCEIEQAPTRHEAFARRPECSSGDAAASSTLRSHA